MQQGLTRRKKLHFKIISLAEMWRIFYDYAQRWIRRGAMEPIATPTPARALKAELEAGALVPLDLVGSPAMTGRWQ